MNRSNHWSGFFIFNFLGRRAAKPCSLHDRAVRCIPKVKYQLLQGMPLPSLARMSAVKCQIHH